MRRFLSVLLAMIIVLLSCGGCSRTKINNMFDSFEVETPEPVAYVYYNTLVFQDKTLNFDKLLKTKKFHEVYVIQNDIVWFGYSDTEKTINGGKQWHIASVTPDGNDLNVVYSGTFCLDENADRYYKQYNNSHKEELNLSANGFYDDGKIILTDHVKTVEFDLNTVSSQEVSTQDYDFPTLPVQVEILDYETITFCKNSEQKTFNTETGEITSKAFKKMMELKTEKDWEGESYLSELFDQVQMVNDQIFILCRVTNWLGETHAIAFQYDFEKNACQYAFHCFMGDIISNDLYVVPTI